jgi:hypothetical protein
MSSDKLVISPRRMLLNRWRGWWQAHLGLPGVLALVLLLAAALSAAVVRPAIATAQRDLLREHVARLDAAARLRAPSRPAADANRRDPRDQLRDSLPPVSQRGLSVATLLPILAQAKVAADRAEYVAEDQEPALVRVRVTVPVEGGYVAARQLIGGVLNGMPHAALDAIEFERPAESGDRLTGQLRFSLFFRKEAS